MTTIARPRVGQAVDDAPVYRLSPLQRLLLLITLVLSTTIYSASVLISSALLPQLQGALSATQDEISWVMTFNIVATAVATPAAGWLADRFGKRATMTWCALVFAVATLMCGASSSLEELIGWDLELRSPDHESSHVSSFRCGAMCVLDPTPRGVATRLRVGKCLM